MSLFERLRMGSSLRPDKRSASLTSIANSLASIATALKIIVLREYKVDLDQPQTRADMEREVFEPIYPDNEREAVSEEVDRIKREQDEWSMSAGGPAGPARTRVRILGGLTPPSVATGSREELTPEEREFLDELGSGDDQR